MTTATTTRKRTRRDYSLSLDTIASIDRIASEDDLPRSRVIDLAIRQLVERREK